MEGDGIDEAESFGAGIPFAESSVGEVGDGNADAMSVVEAFGQFDAGAEFGVEAEI